MSISENVTEVIEMFNQYSDWEDRYREIIKQGKQLPEQAEEYRIEENKVKGCQSQVWLHAELKDGQVHFIADSDASIVKGIISILLKVYSGNTPDEILALKPTFIDEIGLRQHLSMSRANGLNSMLKQISIYALAFKAKSQMQNI